MEQFEYSEETASAPSTDQNGRALYRTLVSVTASLQRQTDEVLKSLGLSEAQYNVLRVLQEALPGSLSRRALAERLGGHDPDLTRLLDRLERTKRVQRGRGVDRRMVQARLLDEGSRLVQAADAALRALHDSQFEELNRDELRMFLAGFGRILTRAYRGVAPTPAFSTVG